MSRSDANLMLGGPPPSGAPEAVPPGPPAGASGPLFTLVHRGGTRTLCLRPLRCDFCDDEFFPKHQTVWCDHCDPA